LRRAWLERKKQATAAIQDLRWKRRAARLGKKPAPEEKEAPTEEKAPVEETREEVSEEKAPQAPKDEAPEKKPTEEAPPEKTGVPPALFPE